MLTYSNLNVVVLCLVSCVVKNLFRRGPGKQLQTAFKQSSAYGDIDPGTMLPAPGMPLGVQVGDAIDDTC